MFEILIGIGAVLVVLILSYLVINGKRNSDPLNRKCAAEICEYITTSDEPMPDEIAEIFMRNARYKAQANHVLSMVPPLLMSAGIPQPAAMSVVPLLRAAAAMVPK